jgi:hypothetical protein
MENDEWAEWAKASTQAAPPAPSLPVPRDETDTETRGRDPKLKPGRLLALQLAYHDYKAANPNAKAMEQDEHLQACAKRLGIKSIHPDTLRDRVKKPIDEAESLLVEK